MKQMYASDVSDKEWDLIFSIFERPHIKGGGRKNAGRKPKYGSRMILNAIFYVLRSGCAWHLLPRDFPPWQTVYCQFRRWKLQGLFIRLHDHVRGRLRTLLGRAVNATAAIIDSQSVKTTEKGGFVDMMEEKKSKGARDILRWTQKDFYSKPRLPMREKVIHMDYTLYSGERR